MFQQNISNQLLTISDWPTTFAASHEVGNMYLSGFGILLKNSTTLKLRRYLSSKYWEMIMQ